MREGEEGGLGGAEGEKGKGRREEAYHVICSVSMKGGRGEMSSAGELLLMTTSSDTHSRCSR